MPAEVVQQIVAKTDGIPLFVEELVKTILESGLVQEEAGRYVLTSPLPPLAIPATLQDALMARLDRLAPVKEIAQLGAVLGREFSYEVLRAVAPLDEATLQQALAQLIEAELLYQRGHPPQATYLFKHALVQDAAYQSLLRSTRQQHHQRIAQVLVTQFPTLVETQPELVAHHYTEASLVEQAIPYWQRAGQHASERSAYLEASSHFTKGLELLKTLPDTPERAQRELHLHAALGPMLMITQGFAAPEVERVYARAYELCQQIGETPQLFPVVRGLWLFYFQRAAYQTARELGEQLLTLAHHAHDPKLLLAAHWALGVTAFWCGDCRAARVHLEQAIALYDPRQPRAGASLYGTGILGVPCLSYVALTLAWLGYLDQARQRNHEALTLVRELAHPFTLAVTLSASAQLQSFLREALATQARAEDTITLATEQGFPLWVASGTILRGWALLAKGAGEEGLVQIRQGLAAYLATGSRTGQSHSFAFLAAAYGQVGQITEGLRVLAEALVVVDTTGEGSYEAELYRLKGELLLAQTVPDGPQAEACLQQALAIARHQEAKSLELRAALSLARLWQQQGKRQEAHALLAPVYHWFTEGWDTADLQEARALLEAVA